MTVSHETAPRLSLLKAIRAIAEEAGDDGFTLSQLFEKLGERVFGAILFALALPCCIPFLYGIPQIVAIPMMAIAFQMALGREAPWLPGKLGDRRIDKKGLERMAAGGEKFFGWMERFAAPRLQFITHRAFEPVIGIVLVVFCASILTPLPATNTTPGIAVAIVAYGLIERDGLLVILGLILGVIWISLLGAAAYFAWDVLTNPDAGTRDVLRAVFDRFSSLFSGGAGASGEPSAP